MGRVRRDDTFVRSLRPAPVARVDGAGAFHIRREGVFEMSGRLNITSGYTFEDVYGYARAVRVGNHVFVSGTTARGSDLDCDVFAQAQSVIGIIAEAVQTTGAELRHVVRTVVYVTNMADIDAVARAHGEAFGAVRPASTLVMVAGLTPANARVEIEATAIIHDG